MAEVEVPGNVLCPQGPGTLALPTCAGGSR
jgi:hypothetical protein